MASVPAAASGGISCVPYARAVTGMQVTGNGGDWWGNAAGRYDRGQRPEAGAVMAFRANSGMTRGHVAVVRQVLNPREVLIDHANWGGPGIRRGSVMQNVTVVDVSARNDWSAVKVQSGYSKEAFGRTYPTYGFIYNRPDDAGTAGTAYASQQQRRAVRYEQVADAPDSASPRGYALQGLAPMTAAQAVSYQPRPR
ncbi:CHAP domain-containing protein [Paeniroseomonas aquatica]|uniref:CHAP domain-containing protein n=1 Tax=Paeniroseomonas aquatica TaxID=373043 RepID=A0ABT8A288_9PROT|nr:CHAP domain-containing protein [Paeniroseomonas aquatica]MDN3563781.1 CHAP domain-containing protein [Paeniroseomonas aquatica]